MFGLLESKSHILYHIIRYTVWNVFFLTVNVHSVKISLHFHGNELNIPFYLKKKKVHSSKEKSPCRSLESLI